MPTLSFRVPWALNNEINKRYKKEGFSDKSEYLRNILERHIILGDEGPRSDDWKIKIWTTLGVTSTKFDHAFKSSNNVEEFFSKLSRSSKIPYKIIYHPEEVQITFSVGEEEIFIRKKKGSKRETIQAIFDELEEKIFGEFY